MAQPSELKNVFHLKIESPRELKIESEIESCIWRIVTPLLLTERPSRSSLIIHHCHGLGCWQNENPYLTLIAVSIKNAPCSALNPLPLDNLSSFLFCPQSVADNAVYVDALSFALSYSFSKGSKSALLTLHSSPCTGFTLILLTTIWTPLIGSPHVHLHRAEGGCCARRQHRREALESQPLPCLCMFP